MLYRIFSSLQISQLNHEILPHLLYEFQETFDHELVMKDWSVGGKAKLDNKKLLFFYQYLFLILYEWLETVFTPYLNNPNSFVPPTKHVVADFVGMLQFFYMIQNNPHFGISYEVDFRSFNPPEGNIERLLAEWKRRRGEYLDHKARIANILRLKGVGEYPIPYRLQRFREGIENNLAYMRQLQIGNTADQSKGNLLFTAGRSKKKSVFNILLSHNNEWVNKKIIMERASVKYDDFRSIIAQLRKDIATQNLSEKFKIESDKKGAYKLTILNSKT